MQLDLTTDEAVSAFFDNLKASFLAARKDSNCATEITQEHRWQHGVGEQDAAYNGVTTRIRIEGKVKS